MCHSRLSTRCLVADGRDEPGDYQRSSVNPAEMAMSLDRPSRMLRLVFRRKAASRPGSVGVVLMELGQGLIERGEAGRVGAREMRQVGVGHLAVADDPGHRRVDRALIMRPSQFLG
jgi:hypothetical protein